MKRIITASTISRDEDIVELMKAAVSQVALPKGYTSSCNVEYDTDEGEIWINTAEDDPVCVLVFKITDSHGDYLAVFDTPQLVIDRLAAQLKSFISSLGDLSQYVGAPKEKHISLNPQSAANTNIKHMSQDQLESYIGDGLTNLQDAVKDAQHFTSFGVDGVLDEFESIFKYSRSLKSAVQTWRKNFGA